MLKNPMTVQSYKHYRLFLEINTSYQTGFFVTIANDIEPFITEFQRT